MEHSIVVCRVRADVDRHTGARSDGVCQRTGDTQNPITSSTRMQLHSRARVHACPRSEQPLLRADGHWCALLSSARYGLRTGDCINVRLVSVHTVDNTGSTRCDILECLWSSVPEESKTNSDGELPNAPKF